MTVLIAILLVIFLMCNSQLFGYSDNFCLAESEGCAGIHLDDHLHLFAALIRFDLLVRDSLRVAMARKEQSDALEIVFQITLAEAGSATLQKARTQVEGESALELLGQFYRNALDHDFGNDPAVIRGERERGPG